VEEQKWGMGVASVTVPPMLTSESNKISIIISPRAASSKVMPFELLSTGNVSSHPHNADAAESSDAHAAEHFHHLPYMTAQILGSIAASFGVKGIYHPVNLGIVTVPKVRTTESFLP
jgi:hypothetical protein